MAYTAIDDPEAYFQVKLYTGTGTSTAFTLDGDTDMQPDAVWFKQRGSNTNHKIFDSVRGVQEALQPNDVDAEATNSNGLTAFGSDGFTIGDHGDLNTSSGTYVAWCWKESATAGFDILTYTGNGSARTISHNLSAVPKFIFLKSRDNGEAGWSAYHAGNTAAPETDFLILNTTAATTDNSGYWNDTAPTSSVFSVGTLNDPNKDGDDFIAYLFSEKQGFSKFGSYTGNGNADGTFVYLGFRPAWLMIKKTSATGNWLMWDLKREGYNVDNDALLANTDDAEETDDRVDLLSNGFKMRGSQTANNASGATYIFAAFAEAPFVNSEGVPCNAR